MAPDDAEQRWVISRRVGALTWCGERLGAFIGNWNAAVTALEGWGSDEWLARFYEGDREVIAQLYTEHATTVAHAVGTILTGTDRESAIHDVFVALMESEAMRRRFSGGSISAWLRQIARNRALDIFRQRKRRAVLDQQQAQDEDVALPSPEHQAESLWLEKLIAHIKSEVLPPKWHPVFEARFVKHLSQRDAAKVLRMRRTTLAYQEARVRAALKKFMLSREGGLFDG